MEKSNRISPRRKTTWLPWLVIVAVAIVVIVFIEWMGRAGFFDFTGKQASAQVVAAALALSGVLVTGAVTAVGLALKQSVDERNLILQYEAESRLKLDSAIRAVQLFTTSSGGPPPPAQLSGAIFTLASLGQHELSLSLVAYLLPRDELDILTASGVCQMAIRCGNAQVQHEALSCLWQNAQRMFTANGAALPDCVVDGCDDCASNDCSGLAPASRAWAPLILGQVLAEKSVDDWNRTENLQYNAYWLVQGLISHYRREQARASSDESDVLRKSISGCILKRAWDVFPDFEGKERAQLYPELKKLEVPDNEPARKVLQRLAGRVPAPAPAPAPIP